MGFQLLSELAAQNTSVLETNAFDSENLPLPLVFTEEAKSSRLWGSAPPSIISIFANQDVTINLHHDGVAPDTYTSNAKLNANVKLLSTNVDRKNKPFGSSLEGKNFPFYGVQFHPERNVVSKHIGKTELTERTVRMEFKGSCYAYC